ncbi:hypothetical protein HMI48_04655 [Acidithiobacillus ferrooxidans]|uniref:hypothetical protein n=1 Tax=Acidithiobacillus ferrooxidans TaxID=920 RepID=UPI001C069E84|nr:hypothetical protein [Acidithiobacillus ferrooxidans]MBU2773221.1 hypothetical protein [Acidithiobacillus ferrooxidans]
MSRSKLNTHCAQREGALMDESGDVSDATWWWNTLFFNLDMAAIHWACDQPAYDIRDVSQFPYYAVEFYHWLADSTPETEWVSAMELVKSVPEDMVCDVLFAEGMALQEMIHNAVALCAVRLELPADKIPDLLHGLRLDDPWQRFRSVVEVMQESMEKLGYWA